VGVGGGLGGGAGGETEGDKKGGDEQLHDEGSLGGEWWNEKEKQVWRNECHEMQARQNAVGFAVLSVAWL
jgi:hypothetical protein